MKYRIGFFPGVWDLCHAGHVMALEEAKEHCDFLVVGLQSDPTIDRPKKNKPVMTVGERIKLLLANRYVDKVWFYDTEKELADYDKGFNYDIRFMGEDHKGKKHHLITGKVIYLSRKHNYSSSELRKRICRKS